MKRLFVYIEMLMAQGFFGTLKLSFQNGKLCNIKVERSIKPENL